MGNMSGKRERRNVRGDIPPVSVHTLGAYCGTGKGVFLYFNRITELDKSIFRITLKNN